MSLLSAHDLVKHHGGRAILGGVSITLESGDRVGLLGRNGAGKTTLVRILTGRQDAESGEILKKRGLTVYAVDQVPDFDPSHTVGEAVMAGLSRHSQALQALQAVEAKMHEATEAELDALVIEQAERGAELERLGGYNVTHKADAVLDALRAPPKDRRLGNCSVGEQRRVALAVGLLSQPDVLVLDEPTNHLDVETIEWLQTNLQSYPGAILLVTHDRYFLDEVATKIAELDRGTLRTYSGNYTEYMVRKAEREAMEARTDHNRLRAIENELTWVRASAPARTTKQKARLKKFDEMVADRPVQGPGQVSFRLPHPPRIGKTILELRGVSKAYGPRTLFEDLKLLLKKGDRIGIIGENGAGKTTLIKTITGDVVPDSGEIVRGKNTEIVYADQGRADLHDDNTVIKEVAGDSDKVFIGDQAMQVQSFLDQLLFDSALQRTKVGALSGGERSRVSLAKALRVAANLLILDEPTNDLDLATLRVLEDALVAYPGCALIVSHDRYFLDRVATAILAFEGDGKVVLYEGGHQLYRDRLKARDTPAPVTEAKAKTVRATKPKAKVSRTRRTFKEQQEFDQMEDRIMEAESKVEALQALTSDPETIRSLGAQMKAKLTELDEARAAVEPLYTRWSQLGELDPYGS